VPDAPQGPVIERDAAVAQRAEHRADPRRLRRREAAAADGALDHRERRVGNVLPCREPGPQVRVRAIAVRVIRVLRQDREHELVERRQPARRLAARRRPGGDGA